MWWISSPTFGIIRRWITCDDVIGDMMTSLATFSVLLQRPSSRHLDRCDRVIQSEAKYPFGDNVYYVTMQITFFTRKLRNGQRNLHCDVVHIATKWVFRLTLDCNGVFAIKAYDFRVGAGIKRTRIIWTPYWTPY